MNPRHNDDCAGRNGGHTARPWSALPLNDEDDFDVMTASVLVHNGRGTFTAQALGHTSKEVVANARLIAAAPDLLEALKALMGEYIADNPQSDGADNPDCSVAMIAAHAAIAKAEGRTDV